MRKEDPFINVMVEQTGVEMAIHQSSYDKYPQLYRHLGLYKEVEEQKKEEVVENKKELTRKEMMDSLSIKGVTFSANATHAELKALLEGE